MFKEGFTTYKQSKYEQYLKLSDRITNQDKYYKNELKVANLIIEIIGEDTVLQLEKNNNNTLGLKELFENITQRQVTFEDLIQKLNNASIDSKKILTDQRILDNTLKKISICKKAYDYGIVFNSNDLSLEQLQAIVTSYEEQLNLQQIKTFSTYKPYVNREHNNIISKKDSYTR